MAKFLLKNEPQYDAEKYEQDFSVSNLKTCSEILEYIVHCARTELIQKHGPKFTQKPLKGDCVNSANFILNLCNRLNHVLKLEISCKKVDTSVYPNLRLEHNFCIIKIQDEEVTRSFLVDCTYIQFFYKKFLLESRIGEGMLKNKSRRNTAKKLICQGYIEITEDVEREEHNLSNYCDCITEVSEKLRKKYEGQSITSQDNEEFYKTWLESDVKVFIESGRGINIPFKPRAIS